MNYRPATAADVGRTDVEVNDSTNNLPWLGPRKLFAIEKGNWPFLAGDVDGNVKASWELARVPILPEECEHDWTWARSIDADGNQERYCCGKCGAPPPEESATRRPSNTPTINVGNFAVTIRRKLEAGGLAEPERAVLIDGKFYLIEVIKSVPGILPQQVEIV